MDKLNLMNSFVHVAEKGSYTAAAQHLGKTKALMSTHISQLENLLEVRLIHRSTRGLQLTDAGKAYYEQAKRILDDISMVEVGLRTDQQQIAGRLRISAPTTFGECVLMPFIAQFIQQHPDINIDVVLNDRFVDLVSEGYDLAIRIGHLADSDLIAVPVGHMSLKVCASTAFIKHFGEPLIPQDLSKLPAVYDSNHKGPKLRQCYKNGETFRFTIQPTISVNNALASAYLAVHANVFTISPDFAVDPFIESGGLQTLLPDFDFGAYPVNAVYSHRKYLQQKINVFNQALKTYMTIPK